MKRFLVILFLVSTTSTFAQVKLARLFSDHVVLQRQKPIPIWGWAKAGEKVTVSLAGQTQIAKAAGDGKWTVRFTPLEAGGPHVLTAVAKSGKTSASDVLIGEVWLCSGQSNIEWPVSAANNFEKEKLNADFPQIRHFRVDHVVSLTPEKDLTGGEWKVASAETVGGFSAIGFFFAREIYQKLNVPIGILHSSWGGSQIEGWISREGMLGNEELKGYAETMPKTWEEADIVMDRKLRKQLFKDEKFTPSEEDEKKYVAGNADLGNWQSAADPLGQWDWKGLMGFRGDGYMAKTIEITPEMAARSTTISLGENDSKTDIYINGTLIKSETVKGIRKVEIPANTWKSGSNQLVVKSGKMVSASWFGPGMTGKPADLYVEYGSQKVSIATDWKLMPSFAGKHEYAHLMNNVGTTIYNAMIVPLIPFAIRGTLWYQGESNAGRSFQYRKTFPLLINDWRKLWNDDFSFYWVQLSSYGSSQSSNQGSGWAELREAQNMALSLPKTGMAVTTDIGNPKDIHPTNKQDVGHRLAVNALKLDYGQNVVFSSPLYEKMNVAGNKAVVSSKYADDGLVVKDKYGYIKGFEIAGDDKVFHYAKAALLGNQIEVSNPLVTKPVSVRYNWTDAPEDGNLFNKEGFPLSPFRTDSWPGITVNNKFQ